MDVFSYAYYLSSFMFVLALILNIFSYHLSPNYLFYLVLPNLISGFLVATFARI